MKHMITIQRYTSARQPIWDAFVQTAKNNSFQHLRAYMDYHNNRFADYSLMAYSGDEPVALLPANRVGDVVYSPGVTLMEVFSASSTYTRTFLVSFALPWKASMLNAIAPSTVIVM